MLKTSGDYAVPLSRVARRKVLTNRRLLEVARRLFSEKGIYWAKVEDITELADLGKGTFYKYFESKERIICALLEAGLGDLLAETEQAVRKASSDAQVLSGIIEVRVDFFLRYPDYLLLFHQVRGLMQLDVDVAKELRDIYDAHLQGLAKLIRPVIGAKGSGGARDTATAIAAYTSGLLTYQILFEGVDGVRRRRLGLIQSLVRSLKPLLNQARPSNGARRGRSEQNGG